MKLLLRLTLLLFLAVFTIFPADQKVEAAQYFAQSFHFTDEGKLDKPLQVAFSKTLVKHVKALLSPLNTEQKMLLLACPEGEDVFVTYCNKSYEYVLYKVKFRGEDKEDLLILGYGKRGVGRTELKEVAVIGMNALGELEKLPLSGFKEVLVFNSPLQVRDKQAVLFRDKVNALVTISADKTGEGYSVEGAGE